MDQSLKERLIGAAVLVALGVWLIPWVLDGKKEQVELDTSGDAALRLPTPQEPLPVRTTTLSLEEPEPFVAESEPASTPPNAPPNATPTATAQGGAPESSGPKPAIIPAATTSNEPVVARADTVPTPSPAQRPIVAPPPKPAAAKAAPAAVARTDAKGGWVVQLGSFGEEENASRLSQRVNTYGYKADVSNHRASGRALYRVRVGPYTTRAQADATASALSAHGFVGQVVAGD